MTTAEIILKPQADRRLKRGHLWIYSNEVDIARSPLKGIEPGAQCQILDSRGKALGTAFINPNQLICGRLVSRGGALSRKSLEKRIGAALAMREMYFSDHSYRLVYGDSDWLPGLVVDRFGDYLVVQISSWGMELLKDDIVAALDKLLSPKGILLRNDHQGRGVESLPAYSEVAVGEVPELVPFIENGVPLLAPVHAGQKTGWFYDHRENRARLNQWVAGKRVLDLFSYAGGWGVQALACGAASATCVDVSEQALDWCEANARNNAVAEDLQTIQGKAVDVLKALVAEGEQYDIVVLDPPAFIKRRKDIKEGSVAYQRINRLAMQLLSPGGVLVSASCSWHLRRAELLEVMRKAAAINGQTLQVLEQGHQGPDHPVHPAMKETDYLKAFIARVGR